MRVQEAKRAGHAMPRRSADSNPRDGYRGAGAGQRADPPEKTGEGGVWGGGSRARRRAPRNAVYK